MAWQMMSKELLDAVGQFEVVSQSLREELGLIRTKEEPEP
jgi:hypothetical protein